MHGSKFLQLCEEILGRPSFQTYLPDHFDHDEAKWYNIYLPPAYQVSARNCPTEPKLFLSDGPVDYSASVYIPMTEGLVQIDHVNKLQTLRDQGAASASRLVKNCFLLIFQSHEEV